MKISREIRLILVSLFSIFALHKYYICEGCKKIHRIDGNEIKIISHRRIYYGHIFVNRDCAIKKIKIMSE